jgi:surface antigen
MLKFWDNISETIRRETSIFGYLLVSMQSGSGLQPAMRPEAADTNQVAADTLASIWPVLWLAPPNTSRIPNKRWSKPSPGTGCWVDVGGELMTLGCHVLQTVMVSSGHHTCTSMFLPGPC